jgi:hypothetical protein
VGTFEVRCGIGDECEFDDLEGHGCCSF